VRDLTTRKKTSSAIHLDISDTVTCQPSLLISYHSHNLFILTCAKTAILESEDIVAGVGTGYFPSNQNFARISTDLKTKDIPCGPAGSAEACKTDWPMLNSMMPVTKR
jgi:hypothetical protein